MSLLSFMGSEFSCSGTPDNMERVHLGCEENKGHDGHNESRKPSRSELYAQHFYCPLAYDFGKWELPPMTVPLAGLNVVSEELIIQPKNPFEMRDMWTTTSQPNVIDTAIGNSQPMIMVDCATGMSQPLEFADCEIQTSQELMLPATGKSCAPKEILREDKVPIILPRVITQTSPPVVPAKMPRLDDLCKPNLSTIYSSSVTYDFDEDEADKENDKSILRQRGTVARSFKASTTTSASESFEDNYEAKTPLSVPLYSSFPLVASRGPGLRVGLSKRSRTRKPLHPRIFESENQ